MLYKLVEGHLSSSRRTHRCSEHEVLELTTGKLILILSLQKRPTISVFYGSWLIYLKEPLARNHWLPTNHSTVVCTYHGNHRLEVPRVSSQGLQQWKCVAAPAERPTMTR